MSLKKIECKLELSYDPSYYTPEEVVAETDLLLRQDSMFVHKLERTNGA